MNTKELTRLAMFSALVFVATNVRFVIPFIPSTGGLVHFGNIALFSIAIVYGKKYGAISGAIGMTVFDLVTGYAIWAPGTFIVRFIVGYAIGYIAYDKNGREGNNLKFNILAMIVGSILIMAGYYLYESLVWGNWITPFMSVIGDSTQSIIGIIGAILLIPHLITLREVYKNQE